MSWGVLIVTTGRSPGRADPSFLAIKLQGTLPAAGPGFTRIPFYTGFTKKGFSVKSSNLCKNIILPGCKGTMPNTEVWPKFRPDETWGGPIPRVRVRWKRFQVRIRKNDVPQMKHIKRYSRLRSTALSDVSLVRNIPPPIRHLADGVLDI